MSIPSTVFAADHAVVESDWGVTALFAGTTAAVAVCADELTDSDQLRDADYQPQRMIRISVRTSLLTVAPYKNQAVAIFGKAMRVQSVDDAGDGVTKNLTLADDTQ